MQVFCKDILLLRFVRSLVCFLLSFIVAFLRVIFGFVSPLVKMLQGLKSQQLFVTQDVETF
jgi:hypothetical protein